ncbi:hypothetical protein DENSPDRAFT_688362 [Dentipellis sp. KUC8613]|nr:hypothetical protein DENSPDRAFT_688362 [Dentipellis sp. KUC8613]
MPRPRSSRRPVRLLQVVPLRCARCVPCARWRAWRAGHPRSPPAPLTTQITITTHLRRRTRRPRRRRRRRPRKRAGPRRCAFRAAASRPVPSPPPTARSSRTRRTVVQTRRSSPCWGSACRPPCASALRACSPPRPAWAAHAHSTPRSTGCPTAPENLAPNDNRPRSGSEASSLNSARPLSTSSGMSGASSSSSTGSVKWDEEGIETVKERAARERAAAHRQAQIQQAARSETRHTSEGRRRAALVDIFPDAIAESRRSSQASSIPMPTSPPIVTIEEATTDEHEGMDSSFETPQKRTRTRPISEQVGMRERPKAICDDVDGVLSILDAATNDLASLINRLDLEATPGTPNTPDCSPLRLPQRVSNLLSGSPSRASLGSPIKRAATMSGSPVKQAPAGLRTSLASVTSLRPYAQSRGHATASDAKAPATWARLGQQIAPWPISPTKPSPPRRSETAPAPSIPAFRLTHKRTLSPAPMADGPIVFRPLRPAKAKSPVSNALAASLSPVKGMSTPPTATTTGVPVGFRRVDAY